MKKLLLSVTLIAFAVAVQAGDAKDSKVATQEKPACCANKTKTSVSTEAKGTCPFAKTECCKQQTQAKAAAAKPQQQALLSPKAASEAAR